MVVPVHTVSHTCVLKETWWCSWTIDVCTCVFVNVQMYVLFLTTVHVHVYKMYSFIYMYMYTQCMCVLDSLLHVHVQCMCCPWSLNVWSEVMWCTMGSHSLIKLMFVFINWWKYWSKTLIIALAWRNEKYITCTCRLMVKAQVYNYHMYM